MPVAALQAVLPELEGLQTQSRQPDTIREVRAFQAELHYELGQRFAQARQPEAAVRAFQDGLHIATTYGGTALADAARLALAGLYRRGAADIDAALRQILPLWQERDGGTATLDRARLAVQLAHIYAQVRDHYECRRYIREAEASLQAIGLGYPIDRSFPTALSGWLEALQPSLRQPNDLRRDLYGALTLHIELAKLYTDILPEGLAREPWYERVDTLRAVTQDLQEADQRQYHSDARLQGRLYGDENDVPAAPVLDFPSARVTALNARIDGYRRRLDAEEVDEDLLHALRADLEQAGRLGVAHLRLAFHWLLGEALTGMERHAEAMAEFRAAYDLSVAEGDLDSALYALNWELICYTPGQHQERLDVCCRAIGLIERARHDISTPYQQSAFLADKQSFYQLGMIAAFKLGQYGEMLRIGELIKSRNLQISTAAGRRAGSRRAALKKKLEDIAARLRRASDEESADLRRARQLFWDQWTVDQAAPAAAGDSPEWSLEALQATLEAGEAILSYHLLDSSVLLVGIIDREQVVLVRQLAESEDWLARVVLRPPPGGDAAFRARVAPGQSRGILLPAATENDGWDGRALADFLLPVALHPLLAGKTRLYITPHRQLHEVPFQALPFQDGFLIEQFAISYLPNLSCRLYPAPPVPQGGLLLVGADQYAPAGRLHLPNLPGAASEVMQLQAAYERRGASVRALLHEGATRRRLQALDAAGELAGFRLLHLALHGADLPGDAPLDARPFLRHAPTAGFAFSPLRPPADLVVLGCCFAA
ncbi:CHAT domain-containing protein, partial [Thiohalocapsa sp.]|uniref:CHAT domain-containing protein n=1 Tax=Thiohalocapsa sp. TaxID=2497641 RepID=UPI0025DA43A0